MIDKYQFGSITIDGKEYQSDVIIYPDKVQDSWWRKEGHNLSLEDIPSVLETKPEVLVIGTGAYGCMAVTKAILSQIKAEGIEVIVLKTTEAVEKFNDISKLKKAVGAFHLTC